MKMRNLMMTVAYIWKFCDAVFQVVVKGMNMVVRGRECLYKMVWRDSISAIMNVL